MILTLLKKDILLKIKNPAGFLIMIALPLVFALVLGALFGPKSGDGVQIKVKLLTEDHDQTFASQFLTGAFGRGELAEMFEVTAVDSAKGRALMDKGKGSALLIIPRGFGEDLLNERPTNIQLIKNPSESFAPKIVEETMLILTEMIDRFVRFSSGPLRTIRDKIDADEDFTDAEMALLAVTVYRKIDRVEDYLFPPAIEIESGEHEEEEESASMPLSNLYIVLLSGISIFCLLFLLEAMAREFYTELENNTLYRQLIGPIKISTFVFSKLLFLFLIGLSAQILIWLTAVLLFGIQIPLAQLGPFVIFSIILLASVTGLIGFIYGFAKTRNQAQAISPAIIIFCGMLGGAMMPVENLPNFMKKVAVISPVYWGQDVIKKLLLDQAGFQQIQLNLLVLGAIAIVGGGMAFLFFERKLQP